MKLILRFIVSLVLIISAICIINIKNEVDIVSTYMAVNHPNIDSIQRIKTANNRIILRDTEGKGLGLLV